MDKIRFSVIGCGAVTELYHLPVITGFDQVDVVALVDKVPHRAGELAERFNVPHATTSFEDVSGQVDAAIVAVPHYLHAPVAMDLMRRGIHVLTEKPMALTTDECNEMIKTASDSNVVLTVGMVCRFYRASQLIKQLIEDGLFGDILGFDLRQGGAWKWPAKDESMFDKERGGGVLTGIGPHGFDLLQWWLGDYANVEYYDDAMGGVEADCEMYLTMENGAKGVIELSRTRRLRNTYILRGARDEIEIDCSFNSVVRLKSRATDLLLQGQVRAGNAKDASILDAFRRQFEDFVMCILNGTEPFVTPESAKKAVRLIENCKAVREELSQDWMKFRM